MGEWTPLRRARLRRLWADDTLSVRQIAESLGVTPSAVSQMRIRLGLPAKYPNRGRKERQG